MSQKPKLVKAISTPKVFGKISIREVMAFNDAHAGEAMPLYTVYGRISSMKSGENDMGSFTGFIGETYAVARNGERYVSACFYPPSKALTEMLQGALGNSTGPVDFAFSVGVKFDDTSATKYVYEVVPLIEAKPSDAIALLEDKLGIGRSAPETPPASANKETGEVPPPKPKGKAKGKHKPFNDNIPY
jgi:hypothetical protein